MLLGIAGVTGKSKRIFKRKKKQSIRALFLFLDITLVRKYEMLCLFPFLFQR